MTAAPKAQLAQLVQALQSSWSGDTCFAGEQWSVNNPARGQCVVSSLIVQDYLGGDLVRVRVLGGGIDEKHYFNKLADGTIIDVTRSQYQVPVTMTDSAPDLTKGSYGSVRERCLDDDDTRERYELLKSRIAAAL